MQYDFTREPKIIEGRILHRIRSETGTLGGFIESEDSSSRDGRAWVHAGVSACEGARVVEDAQVFGAIHRCAAIRGRAELHGDASSSAVAGDDAKVFGSVTAKAAIFGDSVVNADERVA